MRILSLLSKISMIAIFMANAAYADLAGPVNVGIYFGLMDGVYNNDMNIHMPANCCMPGSPHASDRDLSIGMLNGFNGIAGLSLGTNDLNSGFGFSIELQSSSIDFRGRSTGLEQNAYAMLASAFLNGTWRSLAAGKTLNGMGFVASFGIGAARYYDVHGYASGKGEYVISGIPNPVSKTYVVNSYIGDHNISTFAAKAESGVEVEFSPYVTAGLTVGLIYLAPTSQFSSITSDYVYYDAAHKPIALDLFDDPQISFAGMLNLFGAIKISYNFGG